MKKTHPYRRAVAAGFILTLLVCGFVSLSGIALHNTATAMFGTDRSVLEVTGAESEPRLDITFFNTEYEIDLSGANQAAGTLQEHYALVPRKFRLVQVLLAGLKEAISQIF